VTNPPDDLETEQRLRAALKARSERVVVNQSWSGGGSWSSGLPPQRDGFQRGGVRLVLAAATVVALIGIGVAVWSGSRDTTTDVSTATPPATDVPSSDEDGGTPEPDSTAPSSDDETTVDPDPIDGDGGSDRSGLPSTYGPVTFTDQGDSWLVEPVAIPSRLLDDGLVLAEEGFPTAEQAAAAWLSDKLEIEDPGRIEVGYVSPEDPGKAYVGLGVSRMGEGARTMGLGLAVGTAVTQTGDWYVTQVVSDLVWIDSVERNGDLPESLRITGGGWAFESTALLYVDDAEPVIVSVGAFEDPGRFSVVVPWDGDGDVEVMIVAPAIADGATPAATAFVAVPSEPTTTLSVIGVADDDVLNVRSGPGVANEVIGSLDPDATGLTHTGATTRVDGEVWWEILTPSPDSETGWINRRFVAVVADVEAVTGLAEEVVSLASIALSDFGPGPDRGVPNSKYSERIEVGGIGVWADGAHSFQTQDPLELDTDVFWDPPFEMAECVECTKSVREFVGVRDRDTAEATFTVGPADDYSAENYGFQTGLPPELYDRFATVVSFTPASDPQETLDWSRYTFVFDFADGEPEIRAIYRWGWTP